MHVRWLRSLTRITYLCMLIGIPSLAACLKLELFGVYDLRVVNTYCNNSSSRCAMAYSPTTFCPYTRQRRPVMIKDINVPYNNGTTSISHSLPFEVEKRHTKCIFLITGKYLYLCNIRCEICFKNDVF
ncbi:hypothetical protein D5073_12030 [Pectobacterium versatile]|nr:hypothetical protein BZY99_11245 [Pectobacterium versatile]RJL54270.1 hypothetical protein D5073_12030 [Pectobacterium versatile]RJL58011.1 hypothetical protein D5076_12010 [Pectobacterium versatile]RJL62565.1 hypothetical protein D5080_11940 [Pectobacterium versatile]